MGFFDRLFGTPQPTVVPLTSYGYLPPTNAIVVGWACPQNGCGRAEREPVRGWPMACTECGHPADPMLAEPWAHVARGVELQWRIANHPDWGGGYDHDHWEAWQLRHALLRGDGATASQQRARIREYVGAKAQTSDWWHPGNVYHYVVWDGLEAGDVLGAGDDLLFWLQSSSAEGAADDNSTRTNCRQALNAVVRFFDSPGASTHPRAADIRRAALKLAEGAYTQLNEQTQSAIRALARQL